MSEDVKLKLYYVYKGTSNFCNKLVMNDDFNIVKAKPDGFYDIVSTKDTIEGGIGMIELEPTMRLMDELVKTLEQFEPESFVYDEGDENIRLGNEVLASLEKYKKFKEGLK